MNHIFSGEITKKLQLQTPFVDGKPGREWFRRLQNRHPELVLRRPEPTAMVCLRALNMLNPIVVSNYFQELGQVMAVLGLEAKPHTIWNADETGFQLQHKPPVVWARKGVKSLPGRTATSKDSISVLVCINARGDRMPPMIVVKGKTSKSLNAWGVSAGPSGARWTYQEKAWMYDLLGEEWFSGVFLRNCGPERPQLLIMDSHSSHETLGLLERAKQENIHILALPPHTTHHLQPLDKSVFGPLKKSYNTACTQYMSEDPNRIVNKAAWPGLFNEAYEAGVTTRNITSGFRACRIFPFNANALSPDLFLPSTVTGTE